MKIVFGNTPEKTGKGWVKYLIATGVIAFVAIGIFVAVNNQIIGPIVLSGMALVLVTMYAGLLTWLSKTTDTLRKVYHAYNQLGSTINQLTSLTRDLHEVLITVIRLAEYAPNALSDIETTPTNSGLGMENAPESNVEEWSLPSDDSVIPFNRGSSTG